MEQSRQNGICVSRPTKLGQRPIGAKILFIGTKKARTPQALQVLSLLARIESPCRSDGLVAILPPRIAARRPLLQADFR